MAVEVQQSALKQTFCRCVSQRVAGFQEVALDAIAERIPVLKSSVVPPGTIQFGEPEYPMYLGKTKGGWRKARCQNLLSVSRKGQQDVKLLLVKLCLRPTTRRHVTGTRQEYSRLAFVSVRQPPLMFDIIIENGSKVFLLASPHFGRP